jgi:mannose PTS system EIIA component
MIGLVLVSHGRLADELHKALVHVVGPQQQIEVIGIEPEDDGDQRRRDILASIRNVDTGDGVIVVTDMFGGTPSNLAISAMDDGDIEVLAGANLPMLIKLASVRASLALRPAAEEGQNAGRKYINLAGSLLDR